MNAVTVNTIERNSAIGIGSYSSMDKEFELDRPTDEELISRFQQGELAAYDELVKRFKLPLFSFINRIVKNPGVAEDILQETFIRLYINKDSYRQIAKFSTWIFTIGSNLAKTELRKRKVRKWISLSGYSDDDRPIEVVDKSASPIDDVQRLDIREKFNVEINKLPQVFREVIELRDVQELSYDEISSILKVPLGTVKSRVNRGRQRLKKKLQSIR